MRYDLIPVRGLNEVNKVMTSKLEDHTANEWMNGLKWTEVLSNLKKHLTAFEMGTDYDTAGNLSIAQVAADALILAEYFSINPAGDDRIFLPINLERNGFPCAPVYCVPWNESKVELLKKHNVSILIDDKFSNYKDATENGVFCYLMDAPHNKYYSVGHRRIYDLNLSLK